MGYYESSSHDFEYKTITFKSVKEAQGLISLLQKKLYKKPKPKVIKFKGMPPLCFIDGENLLKTLYIVVNKAMNDNYNAGFYAEETFNFTSSDGYPNWLNKFQVQISNPN